ncbi:hypothetical protein HHI36_023951 [Cryptolaemus montrouzieri]|uniref:Uncharacterized protein n=1 Tax=Cryptolaemus montrouzieri TaxID=559131 RepID=A0ABD2PIK8_9CUCU
MTIQQRLQGDVAIENVQCTEVTSTSNIYQTPCYPNSFLRIRGRRSYRTSHCRPESRPYPFHSEAMPRFSSTKSPEGTVESLSTRAALIAVLWIFICSIFLLHLTYRNFPNVTE